MSRILPNFVDPLLEVLALCQGVLLSDLSSDPPSLPIFPRERAEQRSRRTTVSPDRQQHQRRFRRLDEVFPELLREIPFFAVRRNSERKSIFSGEKGVGEDGEEEIEKTEFAGKGFYPLYPG